jgi:hypothetical protein
MEPMRNSETPALMDLCNQLRNTVETLDFKPIKIVPGVIDLLSDEQMPEKLRETFQEQTTESRILAYTNNRVIQYNDFIRECRQLPDEYTVGEFVINNNAIRMKNRMLSVEEELTIHSLSEREDKTLIDEDEDVWLSTRNATLVSRIGDIFNNVPIPTDRAHFLALLKFYKKKGKWPKYFGLKNKFPDLRQRDAATVHKSQGSTYESVFIDLGNISTCRNPAQVARMLYVAVSRARSRVYLYGDLAQKYGGLTV